MSHPHACGAALSGTAPLAIAALILFPSCGADAAPEPPPDWGADPRLVALLEPCPQLGHFDRDTSDLMPVLVEKLSTAPLDVARHLREEVGQAGEAAIDPLDALVRKSYGDRFGVPVLLNALGALRLNESPRARPILRRCLEHPSEDVRTAAAAGLARHGEAQDYEPLTYLLAPGVAGESARRTVVGALVHSDPERLVDDALDWMAAGEHRDLWVDLAPCLARHADADDRERLIELDGALDDRTLRPYLLAARARAGDEDALVELRELARTGSQALRTVALEAAEAAGRPEEFVAALDDGDPVIRSRAASLLRAELPEEWAADALRMALNDPSPDVQQTALEALLSVGEPAAGDLALSLLDGGRRSKEIALHALRQNWEANPGLAQRAREVVLRQFEERAGTSLEDRKALLQALGLLPAPEAGTLLLRLAREADGQLDRMSARRWLVRQAGNTEPGRAHLRQAWGGEGDELLRFDLLEAATFAVDEPSRAFLLEVLHAERSTPWERLYAAERLARQGPSPAVAPVLKRAALREEHKRVRPAFDCLMWRWYG